MMQTGLTAGLFQQYQKRCLRQLRRRHNESVTKIRRRSDLAFTLCIHLVDNTHIPRIHIITFSHKHIYIEAIQKLRNA